MLRADGGPQTPSPRGWPPEGTKQYNLTAVRAAASRLWGAVPSRRRPCRAVATVGRRAVPWVLPPMSSLSHHALHSLGGRPPEARQLPRHRRGISQELQEPEAAEKSSAP